MSVALGVVIGITNSFVRALGVNLQKKYHVLNSELRDTSSASNLNPSEQSQLINSRQSEEILQEPSSSSTPLKTKDDISSLPDASGQTPLDIASASPAVGPVPEYKSHLWLSGLLLYFVAQAGNGIALALAPTIILGSLGGIGLVFNAILAKLLVNEPFDIMIDSFATSLVVCGTFIFGFYGYLGIVEQTLNQPESVRQDIAGLLLSKYALAWVVIMWSCQVFILTCAWHLRRRITRTKNHGNSKTSTESMLLGGLYASVAAIFSSQSFILSKCGADVVKSLIISRLDPPNQTSVDRSAIVALSAIPVSLIFFAAINIYLSNEMMRFADVKLMVPLNFAAFVCTNTLSSIIFFQTWEFLRLEALLKLGFGLSLIIAGVMILSRPMAKPPSPPVPASPSGTAYTRRASEPVKG